MRRFHSPAVGSLAATFICAALAAGAAQAAPAAAFDKAGERAERALRSGEFEEAEKLYREMLQKRPQDTGARLGLSLALLKQRKTQAAYDQAARVVSVEPLSARAHALLGASLLASGNFPLSVEEFRTALSFKDNEAIAVAGLAMIEFYENRLGASLAGLRRAAFIDPSEPDYHFNLGQVAARSERYAEAANAYETFLRIAPRTDADRRGRIRGLIDFLRYLGAQRNLMEVGGASHDAVPFELVNNRPVVTVRINGLKDPLRFVLDTGSGMCVLSVKAANRLGVRPVARGGTARAVGGQGRFEIIYGFLQTLQLGESRIERVPVYLREFYNDNEPVDGYIGLSFLSKYLASVDYGARTLTLARGDAAPRYNPAAPPPGVELPIRTTSSGFWSGEVRIDGVERPVNFIIDTGATISVVSEALAVREAMDRFAQPRRIRIYGAAGLSENVQTLNLPRMFLGSHVRPNVAAAVLDMDSINETAGFEQTGIVGGNVLRHFRVTFDFQRAVVRLEPAGGAPPAPGKTIITSQP